MRSGSVRLGQWCELRDGGAWHRVEARPCALHKSLLRQTSLTPWITWYSVSFWDTGPCVPGPGLLWSQNGIALAQGLPSNFLAICSQISSILVLYSPCILTASPQFGLWRCLLVDSEPKE